MFIDLCLGAMAGFGVLYLVEAAWVVLSRWRFPTERRVHEREFCAPDGLGLKFQFETLEEKAVFSRGFEEGAELAVLALKRRGDLPGDFEVSFVVEPGAAGRRG